MATLVTKTIGATGKDYTTVSAWEAATDNDLVTADEIQEGEVANETVVDTATVTFTGATVDATRFRRLKAATNYDIDTRTGSQISNSAATGNYVVQEAGFELIGLGVKKTTGTTTYTLQVNQSDASGGTTRMLVEKCTVDAHTTATARGVLIGTASHAVDVHFWNNIILCDGDGVGDIGFLIGENVASGVTLEIHNNLVLDFDQGGSQTGDGFLVQNGTNSGTINVTNNIGYNSSGADWASMNLIGGTHTEDYNAASDTTANGTNSVDSVATTAFEDFTGYDFTPASGGALEDAGTSQSSLFTDDYYGNTRGATWDIGPIELVGGSSPLNMTGTAINEAAVVNAGVFNVNIAGTAINEAAVVSAGVFNINIAGTAINEAAAVSAGVFNINIAGVAIDESAVVNAGTLNAEGGTTPLNMTGTAIAETAAVSAGVFNINIAGTAVAESAVVSAGVFNIGLAGAAVDSSAQVNAGTLTTGLVMAGGAIAELAAVNAGTLNAAAPPGSRIVLRNFSLSRTRETDLAISRNNRTNFLI